MYKFGKLTQIEMIKCGKSHEIQTSPFKSQESFHNFQAKYHHYTTVTMNYYI